MSTQQQTLIQGLIGGVIGGAVISFILFQQPQLINRMANNSVSMPTQNESQKPFSAADSHEASVVRVVEQSQPAVVSIVITKDVPILEQYYEDTPGTNPLNPFGDFFSPFQFRVPQLRERGTQRQEIGGGSGFIISADGMIVTNKHVVNDQSASYTVFTNDGTKYEATLVARDPANDIAILKINGSNFPHLEFTDSNEAQVGQSVVAIGNALGEFQNTVSVGVISGLSRSIVAGDALGQPEQLDEVIQTDAAINPGNSGGPLLTLQGKVIGVNVAVALGSQNVGFALPANTVSAVVDSVQKTGRISRPYIGVRYTLINPALKESNNLPVDQGALVVRGNTLEELAVVPGSPANKAGIQENDIILEVDGQAITEDHSLSAAIRDKKVGDTVTVKLLQQGAEKEVTLTLEEAPQ